MSRATGLLGRAVLSAAMVIALAGCNAICLVAPCDAYADALIKNECGYSIDAKNSDHTEGFTIPDGDSQGVYSSGGPFDVVLRGTGTNEWMVTIPWDRIKDASEENGIPFVVEGDDCPT